MGHPIFSMGKAQYGDATGVVDKSGAVGEEYDGQAGYNDLAKVATALVISARIRFFLSTISQDTNI